jgi:hypothetical protein
MTWLEQTYSLINANSRVVCHEQNLAMCQQDSAHLSLYRLAIHDEHCQKKSWDISSYINIHFRKYPIRIWHASATDRARHNLKDVLAFLWKHSKVGNPPYRNREPTNMKSCRIYSAVTSFDIPNTFWSQMTGQWACSPYGRNIRTCPLLTILHLIFVNVCLYIPDGQTNWRAQ